MHLKKSRKITVLFAALATALCLATTPAMARGGFGGHGGGMPHSHAHAGMFRGGPSHFGGGAHFGGSRGSMGQMAPGRSGSRGSNFNGRGGNYQSRGVTPGQVYRGNSGQGATQGGIPFHPLNGHQAQGSRPQPAPGGGYQSGQMPPPPMEEAQQGVDPLELLSEVLSLISGGY